MGNENEITQTPHLVLYKQIAHGDVIRGYRAMFGWTRQQLADMMDVTVGTIASWETGRTDLRLKTVSDIARLFGDYQANFWRCIEKAGELEGS
jgi:DNA-binding XRE family transcriptional regulator